MPEDLAQPRLAARIWDRGGARPVLALHCSLAHSGAWGRLVEHLDGIRVFALDQPGHGDAPDWDGVSDLHDLATRDALGLLEEIVPGLGPVDLFGHSFGGTVALRLAQERPDLVRSLVLVEPVLFAAARAAGDPAWPAFAARHDQVARLIADGRHDEGAALFHGDWGTGGSLADMPERARTAFLSRIHLIPAQSPALIDDRAGLLSPGRMEALDRPVLLVEGANSPPIIDAVHSALAARLPDARRVAITGAGHMLPMTHAAELADAVRAHLGAV